MSACCFGGGIEPDVKDNINRELSDPEIISETISETMALNKIASQEFEAVLNEHLKFNQRLEDIAYQILVANVMECPDTRLDMGIKLHIVQDYPEDLQMFARVYLGVDMQPAIRVVANNSPAFKAGLQQGDKILKIQNQSIPPGDVGLELYKALSLRAFDIPPVTLHVQRGHSELDVDIIPQPICSYPVQLFYGEIVNAHTNGEEIWVTSELMRQIQDDTLLGMIIAHELAHATLGHIFMEPAPELELEADRLSLIYLNQAGFDPYEAVRLWESNPLNHKPAQNGTHPEPYQRLQILLETLSEL